jgi:hypothetical protein
MNDEYSRLKARYRETRNEEATWENLVRPKDAQNITASDRQAQELADFCVASGIDLEDLHQFLAEVDKDIMAQIPQ